ncbi:MAG TPA: ABC transporter ATP-binding protein [Acholeplasmataceae bacterium]|jgi:ATP-binding cassette subfamily B multidrug efflux pump|nr:ABC transporter ATP-binding protein [Acholeplasmataceae bacterium]
MILKIGRYIKGYKKETFLTLFFIFLEVVFEVAIPFLIAKIVDDGIKGNNGTGELSVIILYGSLVIVFAIFALIFGVLAGRTGAIASAGFAKNLRQAMYYKVQDYSFENIDRFSTASLITRMTADVTMTQQSFQMVIRIFTRAPLMIIGATIMALTINPALALIYIIAIPVLSLSLYFIIRKAFPLFMKMFKKYDRLNASIQENLIGIRVVKAFVREDYEIEKFKKATNDLFENSKNAQKIMILANPILQLTINACMIAIAWFGGKLIISEMMETGQLMSFLSYTMQILMNLMMISMVMVMVTMARASTQRILEVLEEQVEIVNPETPVDEVKDGSIEFKDVYFSYSKNLENPNLKKINLKINSGETVGIIGSTGSAKSTLVQLIPRLYDVTSGEVLVGGIDVRRYDLSALRNNVSMVLQKNVLFSGTIQENLRWGDENATMEEIINASKLAQAHDFIMEAPGKYEHDLGQGGINVSGGQKQRLTIARALLKRPKILILDDSTSAVDTKTEALIRDALKNELADVTKIIIAQRISSVENADKIIVLDEGEINGIGSPAELLQNNKIYQEIYYSQLKGGTGNAEKNV